MSSLYTAADLYDLVHLGPWKGEAEFYLRQADRFGRRVLELACGTGRLTVPLAQRGLTLTGLDNSAEMLERARAKAERAGVQPELRLGDMRDFHLGQRFDLIFLPINSICHLYTRADIEACFRCVREHLQPAGRFCIDVFNPSLISLAREGDRWYEIDEYTDADGRRVRLTERNHYDRATQINHLRWRFEPESGRPIEHTLTQRQFFPQELDALLHYNGFLVEARYGKYGEKDSHAESNQQLVVARLA
jgi:SAM-dependent methyltransferase